MIIDPAIIVESFPDDDPSYTKLIVRASNGLYGGTVEFYCDVNELLEIGRTLQAFPSIIPEEFCYPQDSADRKDNYYSDFVLRAYTVGPWGHCALQLLMDLNSLPPDEGRCCFSIHAEPLAIARLGELFVRLSKKPQGAFRWTLIGGEFAAQPYTLSF